MRKAGLLPFEAHALSRVPLEDIPYLKQLLTERRAMLAEATKKGLSQQDYERQIKQIYIDGSLIKVGTKGDILLDPFQLLRKLEEDYIAKHPDYVSPWKKRSRGWKNFISRWERTVEKQQDK